ncbi:diacylglycerol kinase family protein [Sphingopyxis sp. PET50]|uniref:diacylglycerol kinase family protein n=1 Tax=Sphingopyxis sp. PET50 TaxID=2976533 RepID=UPI0021AF4901|nr:diacylglycerol kinase family protein [Sphingopyxis sp. PET50]
MRRQGIDLLLVWTGDGTINAAASKAAGWDGALLPLPGGTLNLLSKQLHGDRSAPDILADALAGKGRCGARSRPSGPRVARRSSPSSPSPATRWAEVRETMRQDGLIEASRAAPEALDTMLNAPGVGIAGQDKTYPAVILTPTEQGIAADGIMTEGTADVLRHGLAWLGGDFRDGPSERLATAGTILLESEAPISLEYDGELGEIPSPARFSIATSAVDFLATA